MREGGREGGREDECRGKGCDCNIYRGPSAGLPPAPRLSADSLPSPDTLYGHSLHVKKRHN